MKKINELSMLAITILVKMRMANTQENFKEHEDSFDITVGSISKEYPYNVYMEFNPKGGFMPTPANLTFRYFYPDEIVYLEKLGIDFNTMKE